MNDGTNVFSLVKQRLDSSGEEVKNRLVDLMVEDELSKRVATLKVAIEKLQQLSKELRKVKPDQVVFDENGNAVQTGFSKNMLDAKRKLQDQVDQLDKAVDNAMNLTEPDAFAKLNDKMQKLGK